MMYFSSLEPPQKGGPGTRSKAAIENLSVLPYGNPPPLTRGGICSERCFAALKPPLARGGAEAFAEAERFLNRERCARPTITAKASARQQGVRAAEIVKTPCKKWRKSV
jgi:hypothetical protein